MTDHPILLNGPMVRALLDGRKSQTRRVLRPQPPEGFKSCKWNGDGWDWVGNGPVRLKERWAVPLACPGTRLWVREAHYLTDDGWEEYAVFAADSEDVERHLKHMERISGAISAGLLVHHTRLRPSIHMPRWASRITLTVTDVRVQRVQEISEEDVKAEGLQFWTQPGTGDRFWGVDEPICGGAVFAFSTLWDGLNEKRGFGWAENPWVVAYSFTVERRNIDALAELIDEVAT